MPPLLEKMPRKSQILRLHTTITNQSYVESDLRFSRGLCQHCRNIRRRRTISYTREDTLENAEVILSRG